MVLGLPDQFVVRYSSITLISHPFPCEFVSPLRHFEFRSLANGNFRPRTELNELRHAGAVQTVENETSDLACTAVLKSVQENRPVRLHGLPRFLDVAEFAMWAAR